MTVSVSSRIESQTSVPRSEKVQLAKKMWNWLLTLAEKRMAEAEENQQ